MKIWIAFKISEAKIFFFTITLLECPLFIYLEIELNSINFVVKHNIEWLTILLKFFNMSEGDNSASSDRGYSFLGQVALIAVITIQGFSLKINKRIRIISALYQNHNSVISDFSFIGFLESLLWRSGGHAQLAAADP